MRARIAVSVAAGLLALGCAGRMPSPTSPGAPAPAPSAVPSALAGSVIVTFRVGGTEEFRVLLVDPADIAIASGLLSGKPGPAIPNGRIVRGENTVNPGHRWTLDPGDFEFADFTTEVCDGLPSHVDDPSFTSDRYCPWAAVVIGIEPAAGT